MVLYLNKKRTLKLRLAGEHETWQKTLLAVIAALTVIALALGAVAIPMFAKIKHVTIEAGEDFSATALAKDENASFSGFDVQWTRRPGVYYFTLISQGQEREVRLKVVDTKAPEVVIREVKCAIGGQLPVPMDFIESVYEADECYGEFVTTFPKIDRMGEYKAQVRFYDTCGNFTDVLDVKMSVVSDNEAPKINVPTDKVEVFVGDTIDISKLIAVSDNCVGELEIKIDDGEADFSSAGEYVVKITAKDSVGNTSRAEITVAVKDNEAE